MKEFKTAEDVSAFLDTAKTWFMGTEDGPRPRVRPLSFKMMVNGKLYFGVGTFKDAYKQLQENPYVEMSAFHGMDIIRYYGKAVFDDDPALFDEAIRVMPMLKQIYNEETGYKYGIFYLAEASVEYCNMADYTQKTTYQLS